MRATAWGVAGRYIYRQSRIWEANPSTVGTGGTPFIAYLSKHRDEMLAHLPDPQALASYVRSRLVEIVSDRRRDAIELKALELLGKSAGMFDPRSRQPQQHLHLHAEISDREAAELAERAARRGRTTMNPEPPAEA